MLWCKSHYKLEFAKNKARELRESGNYLSVYLGNYITEYDSRTGKNETCVKIYLKKWDTVSHF